MKILDKHQKKTYKIVFNMKKNFQDLISSQIKYFAILKKELKKYKSKKSNNNSCTNKKLTEALTQK